MRLGVDGSCWGGQERGVAVATRRLWSALLRQPEAPRVTAFTSRALSAQLAGAAVVDVGPFSGAARFVWQHATLPRLVREHQIGLLHCPCYTAPLVARCRTIVTVHDLIAWSHPRLAGWRNATHLRLLVGRAIRRADAVCVPTHVVARAVIERFGVPAGKIFVVPWGVDTELDPMPAAAAAREVTRRFGIERAYVLCCGCIEPKKNLGAALRAATDAGLLLVMAGPWIDSSAHVLGGADPRSYRYLGYVSNRELSALYTAATALLAPSHVEGFGMPAIEAMRLGCPVIAADTPVAREVCGEAARYATIAHPTGFSVALRAVVTDRVLRDELVARGAERAAKFSWATTTTRFAEALHHAAR